MVPPPGWGDCSVTEPLRLVVSERLSAPVMDFGGGLRLMEQMAVLRVGTRFHTNESKRWWPCQSIPWLGFDVDTRMTRVCISEEGRVGGQRLQRDGICSEGALGGFVSELFTIAGTKGILPPEEWMGSGGRIGLDGKLAAKLLSRRLLRQGD